MLDAIAELVPRFVALATGSPADLRVPATPAWTITDVVGHVAMEPMRYLELAAGGGDWPHRVADLPAFNAQQVADLPTRDIGELTDLLTSHTQRLVATIAEFDEPPLMRFDGDQFVPADLQAGTFLGELIVHGRDIAHAAGKDWPIEPAMVPLVYLGLHQVLPGWVDPKGAAGHTATYELRLRGSTAYIYEFTDGRLQIDPPAARRVDAHISADPVTALLTSYGRVGQIGPAITGKVLAWGRRPWLATSLRRRFMSV
ncbi:MAG: maleylpyruvate isomerase family mycothiol-dependent enzyme [Propionibacteriales bacterium]|nr:maleylpyruvate isomerase family mycothiol-dependent enzyme [Propionibacteriales bacterium]